LSAEKNSKDLWTLEDVQKGDQFGMSQKFNFVSQNKYKGVFLMKNVTRINIIFEI